MCENAWRRRTIHLHNGRLASSQCCINLSKWRGSVIALDDGIDSYLRIELADLIPADARACATVNALQFLIEHSGCFGKAMPTQHHRDAGEGAADVANRVGFLLAKTEFICLPLRVLLGVVDEFKGHGSPPVGRLIILLALFVQFAFSATITLSRPSSLAR